MNVLLKDVCNFRIISRNINKTNPNLVWEKLDKYTVCGEQKRTAHITNIKIRDMSCKSSI